MPLTEEQKAKIKNHFRDVPMKASIFRGLIDIDFPDEEKKETFLAIIDKMETEIAEVKTIVETLGD